MNTLKEIAKYIGAVVAVMVMWLAILSPFYFGMKWSSNPKSEPEWATVVAVSSERTTVEFEDQQRETRYEVLGTVGDRFMVRRYSTTPITKTKDAK